MNPHKNSIHIYLACFNSRLTLKPVLKFKVIITLLIVMICTGNLMAQFSKGRMLVGGTASFSSLTTKDDAFSSDITSNMFTITPRAGYFIIDNLAIGLDVSFGITKASTSTSSQSSKSTSILAGPYVRYYLKPGIFFQGEYQLGSSKVSYDATGIKFDYTENLSAWAISAGYALFLNDQVAVEPMISYKSSVAKESMQDYKGTNAGVVIGIGLQIYLGKNSR